MTKYEGLTPEERARVTDIQDLLIERFVERKEAIEERQESARRSLRPKLTSSSMKRTT
jgi:hypothetical protein